MTDFDRAFAIVVGLEGGYVNDPRDPGGKTKFGIADAADGKVDGRTDIDRDGDGDVVVEMLTIEQAKEIYHVHYWQAAHCDTLPWPLSLCVFDAAVNQGVGVAVRLLQKAAGVAQDGIFGKQTAKAIASQDPIELASLFMADRGLRYTGTRNFDRYGRGWFKRLFKIALSGV